MTQQRPLETRRGTLRLALLMLLGTAVVVPIAGRAAQAPVTRRVHVSAVDKAGVPVTDLTANDLEVKVGGKTQTVVGLAPATGPMRIAVLVADGGTGAFQLGLSRFAQRLRGRAEFQFTSVIVQPQRVGPYSGDWNSILPALNKIGVRGNDRSGAQLLEGLLDATQDIRTETSRSVIVVMRIGGEAESQIPARTALNALQDSQATLYVASIAGANRARAQRAPATAAGTMERAVADFQDSEESAGALNLDRVLGDGSRLSGGRHDVVVSNTLVRVLEGIADELLGQYEVTYTVPPGMRPTDRFSVGSKRRGLTVRAATWSGSSR